MADPQAPPQKAPAKHENVFTRKIGPLPMWAWTAILATVILLWAYLQHKNSQSSQAPGNVAAPLVITTPPEQGTPDEDDTAPTGKKGPGHHHKRHKNREISYQGHDLYAIAKEAGISEQELVKLNPDLRKYVGTGKGPPRGTKIKV